MTYYADRFEGRKTASGEVYRHSEMTAASRKLPFGTWVSVSWQGKTVVVKINDRGGPKDNGIDLSKGAASQLGMLRAGRVMARICPR